MKNVFLITVIGSLVAFAYVSYACNEAVCASIVSKCMITQSCKCDLVNCSCCKECFSCLNNLYSECCSCVDMCPKPNVTTNELSRKSHVEDLSDSVVTLFTALVSEPDLQQRWESLTYPIDLDIEMFQPDFQKEFKLLQKNSAQDVSSMKITLNCSVVFMSQCLSWNKCKASCISMGAKSYRWFHDGCCECVGELCLNYGLNQSRCKHCPLKGAVVPTINEADYGDDEDDDEEMIQ
ncbi:protein twisted gastrulation-like [Melanaphis sacchari]|uniref:Protein twisted gastrulation n=1 Tax=Melanaphis sacchari TaxID=742174 RepID=A0A2H8U083_9HEMI|nr:protein twisted gastrulation-like [Melanaphis sacchari]XP_025206007.1 protein twisted gastrulation-like [Melanaphis sacchari]XP_025206008.1 protein twisted gastrulation-like [Melanaphis sacchari]